MNAWRTNSEHIDVVDRPAVHVDVDEATLNLHLLCFIKNVKLQRPADTSLLNCPPSCILVQ